MAKACFKSKSFSAGQMGGSMREHNERDFDPLPLGLTRKQAVTQARADLASGDIEKMPHYAPSYLLNVTHPPGNQSFHRMNIDDVTEEYMTTTKWGQKHGKFHHKANPFREAIVTFEAHHTLDDFERLADRLESELDIQIMYGHLHRDEGHMNEQDEPIFNFHAHLGFTNLKNGKLNHFDADKCRRAQDICAEVLGMERGEMGSDAQALDHREFRASAKYTREVAKNVLVAVDEKHQTTIDDLSNQVRDLLKENSKLAEELGEEKTKAKAYSEIKQSKAAQDTAALQKQLAEAQARYDDLNRRGKQWAKNREREKAKLEKEKLAAEKKAQELAKELEAEQAKPKLVDATDLQLIEEFEKRTVSQQIKHYFADKVEAMIEKVREVHNLSFFDAFKTLTTRNAKSVVQDAPQEPQRGDNGITRTSRSRNR